MNRSLVLSAAASVAMIAGCVPVEKYNALKVEARQYEESLKSAQTEASSEHARAEALQKRLDAGDANSGNAMGLVGNLQSQLAAKQTELDELNKRYNDAINSFGKGSPLPAPLTSELKALAAANSDLIEFDESRGIVKFKSDVTFDVGDAGLKPKAKEILTKFAAIINSGSANGYELLIAGHTDSTPVSNPNTLAKGHKNNWYLSAHRAISVTDALITEHVNPQRIGAVGYADQRPVASNSSDKGKEANRRVEVLILPTQVKASAPAPEATPTAPAPVIKKDNKDAGMVTPVKPKSNDNK